MPRQVAPRPAPTAEALYDKNTGKLWIEYPTGESIQLGAASGTGNAHSTLTSLGLTPAGSWVTSYGPLRSCLVGVPEGWVPPAP
jgi:hypothetical protein